MRACSHERWHSIQIKQSQLFAIVPRRSSSNSRWKQCSPGTGASEQKYTVSTIAIILQWGQYSWFYHHKIPRPHYLQRWLRKYGNGQKTFHTLSSTLETACNWNGENCSLVILSLQSGCSAVSVSNQLVLFIIVFLMSLPPISSYPRNLYPVPLGHSAYRRKNIRSNYAEDTINKSTQKKVLVFCRCSLAKIVIKIGRWQNCH